MLPPEPEQLPLKWRPTRRRACEQGAGGYFRGHQTRPVLKRQQILFEPHSPGGTHQNKLGQEFLQGASPSATRLIPGSRIRPPDIHLQKNPGSWLVKPSTVLDRTNQRDQPVLDETSVQQPAPALPAPWPLSADAIRFVTGLAGGLLHRQINYRPPHSSHYCGASNRPIPGTR